MGIKKIERLYRKMVCFEVADDREGEIDTDIRADIFQNIMDDLEKLQKKIKRYRPGTEEHRELDFQIRQLLLKEIQVIIDDYIVSRKNGTLELWEDMYGDINHYIKNYYMFRRSSRFCSHSDQIVNGYGFYDQE